jgi:hypothetical protein
MSVVVTVRELELSSDLAMPPQIPSHPMGAALTLLPENPKLQI